jgi:hypothetical protein
MELGFFSDFGCRLGSLTFFPAFGCFVPFRNFRDRPGSGFRWRWGNSLHYSAPSNDMGPSGCFVFLLCRMPSPGHLRCGRSAGCTVHAGALNWRPLGKRGLRLFPLTTAPVVGCVVVPTDAAFKLLSWGRTLPGKVRLTTNNTSRHVSAVALRVAEALTMLTL